MEDFISTNLKQASKINDIFKHIKIERNDVASIHKSLASFPEGMNSHFEFYKSIILDDNLPLSRGERELLAVLTSEKNSCHYCITHHQESFDKYSIKISKKKISFYKDLVLVLTKDPSKASLFKKKISLFGILESEYTHAIMIISYFNMVNRIVFALDVKLEDDYQKLCN